jgi:hypothetical protein
LHDRLLALSCGVSPCLPPKTAASSVVLVRPILSSEERRRSPPSPAPTPPAPPPKKPPLPSAPLTGLADASAVDDAASSASALAAASSATFEKSRRFRAASHSATRSISVSTARRRSEKTPVGAQTSVDPPSASASQARALSRKRWRRLTRVLVSLRHFWKWVSD